MMRLIVCALLFALVLLVPSGWAQEDSPQLVRIGSGLFSLHGTDAGSDTQYLRYFLLADSGEEAMPQSAPTLVIECTQAHNRRELHFFVNFGGVEDIAFTPPFKPTPTDRFPPANPTVAFRMTFEGYMRSKPFKRSWEQLPNGNYKYRNPGADSFNLDGPRYFMQYLNSLPGFRVVAMKPERGKPAEVFFQTKPLLEMVSREALCQP
ncbi:hypothetical protein H7849_03730 [Alloacidobacterium dinghuense]|uniref:Uncharacterized protein n=1 Tax=Alloacidobacterium dinghuense TaxID=2763107 RepID=A0A7G8BKM9_9BACT|nr:hypothetical protein [Alloacidobacterium dinghuense]QNI33099.1 hypothetical protein H7849_03730 [Alloacidobacterium dinghuense]